MKTVLITGANKGIGFETARQLAQAGYFVFLGARNEVLGKQAQARLHEEGLTQIWPLVLDVIEPASLARAVRQVEERVGRLDALVNNAGIRGPAAQPPSSFSVEEIKTIFETNFFGVIQTTQAFLPLLQKAPEPRIVNVTSELASLSLHKDVNWKFYRFKGAGYAPSKTALNAYTLMLAYELKDTAFRVNAVNPGYTATDFNHYAGEQSPREAAKVIVQYATLDGEGPSGLFAEADRVLPW